jgi:hypothetical protein
MEQFIECFEDLKNPWTGNAARHDFHELLMIAFCAILCGGQGAVDMALFARSKLEFLRGFLDLNNGPPSHDTFSRLFRLLDPDQLRIVFQRFMGRFGQAAQAVVAIDGKVLRRSFHRARGQSPLHMVSAWASEQGLVLGQVSTDAKSNEITAVHGRRKRGRKHVGAANDAQKIEAGQIGCRETTDRAEALAERADDKINTDLHAGRFAKAAAVFTRHAQ